MRSRSLYKNVKQHLCLLSHLIQVRLLDSLVSSIEFSKTRDAELAWIDAILDIKSSDMNKDVTKENETEEMEDEPAPGEWGIMGLIHHIHW